MHNISSFVSLIAFIQHSAPMFLKYLGRSCIISLSVPLIALLTLTITSIIAIEGLSYADIYQYVDEKGVVHFTNTPNGNGYKKVISEGPKGNQAETTSTKNLTVPEYYNQIIASKSIKYNLEPSLIHAVITAESNWQPTAVSGKGAMGLMQLMPSTAKDMNVNNPFDPEENIEGGTRYLRLLLDRFNGDLTLALAGYNAGPETVRKFGGIPPISETKQYIKQVISLYKKDQHKPTSKIAIYKVILEDGSALFTNTPSLYKGFTPYKL